MRVLKGPVIREQLGQTELAALENDFRHYKSTGVLPDTFGRDVLYDHPHTLPIVRTEAIKHIHLASADKLWERGTAQYRRTSDVHLVYCEGALIEGGYLLIAILSPDAHEQARRNDIMYKLGVTAEKFRGQF